ncbi:MAG: sodium:proton antiporter, partial [Firmicutes bacterium]|nr:sodium:proton antiporter [Bacillota bacterium]
MEKKKLEFYGGTGMSFLPFVIFIVMIIMTTFVWQSISDGALWVPAFTAILIPFFFAKDKKYYAEAVINGMASREAIIPVVCWIFAGVFSRILRMSGLANGIAGVAASIGVGPTTFAVITFLAAALFATASGTGFGTIAA